MSRFAAGFWEHVTPPGYADIRQALHDLYVIQDVGMGRLVKLLGVSDHALRKKLRALGLPLKTHGGYRHGRRKVEAGCSR